jgi:hypothetical protein
MNGSSVECPSCFIIASCYPPVVHVLVCIISVLFQEGCKVLPHSPLEKCGCIAHPKVHNIGDVCSIVCLYCCLVLVFIGQLNIIVAMLYVKFQEECFSLQSFHHCSDARHCIVVLNCPHIYSSVIDNDPLFTTVFLSNEEDRGYNW